MTRLFVLVLVVWGLIQFNIVDAHAKTRTSHRSWKGHVACKVFAHSKKGRKAKRHYLRTHHGKRCHYVKSRELRKRLGAVGYAKSKLGHPYVWGATGPWAFDCSGLMVAAYRHVGRPLPRTTWSMLGAMRGRHATLRIGDLVFSGPGHVGMYVGGRGRVIEAPHTGAVVRYRSSYPMVYVRSPF